MASVAIVGPGSVGAFFAAHLAAAGHGVLSCARRPFTDYIVESPDAPVRIAADVATDPLDDRLDRLFDVVLLRGSTRLGVIQRMTELYRGAHVAHPSVHVVRGRSVTVSLESSKAAPLRLEIDGEGGALGKEELKVIGPAIERARKLGVDCHGPFAA